MDKYGPVVGVCVGRSLEHASNPHDRDISFLTNAEIAAITVTPDLFTYARRIENLVLQKNAITTGMARQDNGRDNSMPEILRLLRAVRVYVASDVANCRISGVGDTFRKGKRYLEEIDALLAAP